MEATIRFSGARPSVSVAVTLPFSAEKSGERSGSKIKEASRFVLYRLVATPSAWVYLKVKYNHRIENTELLSRYSEKGFYLYGNRTGTRADALVPSMLTFPKKAFVVVDPEQIPGTLMNRFAPSLGAISLPDGNAQVKSFLNVVQKHTEAKDVLVIYPEASAGNGSLQPFVEGSFQYPVRSGAPSFCFTNVLRDGKLVTYLDGPFYPNTALSVRERREDLLVRIRTAMENRLK